MRPAHLKEKREKQVRQIWREQRKIRNEIRALPEIKLDKPIRHGWYKEIVLTENLDRYKTKKAIEEIFHKLDTYCWGRTKKQCDKLWNDQRSRSFIYRDVPTISKKQFNELSEKSQLLCTPFQYREYKKWLIRFYIRIPKNAYRIKHSRAYITHIKMIDPDLISRESFLEQSLLKPGMYGISNRSFKDFWSIAKTKKLRISSKQELRKYKNASAESAKRELWEKN